MYQDNLIRVFPNAFSDEFCDALVKKFEDEKTSNKERYSNTGVNFTQLNFRLAGWEKEQSDMVHAL